MLLKDDFVMQGGVRNYLGKTEEVKAPKFWKSSKDSPKTELAYITDAEKGLLLNANLHGSLKDGKPNVGASGLLSYDGWGDASDGFGGGNSGGGNSGGNDGDGGRNNPGDQNTYNPETGTTSSTSFGNDKGDGGNNYVAPNPQLPPGVISNNFDYETDAYSSGSNNIDQGYGLGEITNATYDKETGLVNIEQTPGIINTEQYQTANLGAYLDSPDVSNKDKKDTLNRLQQLSNSNLKGSKLSDIETDFVLENLDLAFNNIKDQTKYSEYTSSIDENAKTFSSDLSNNILGTVAASGGVIGTMVRGVTDSFKNNKALETLGYTGSTIKYNPDGSGDFKYTGNYLTGNVSQGERDAVNQLTPLAANIIGNTTPQESMVNNYFANMGNNLGVSSAYMNTYNAAKDKISQSLNLQPNNQQYGYGNNFNQNFDRSMTSANPFFDELTNQGLI